MNSSWTESRAVATVIMNVIIPAHYFSRYLLRERAEVIHVLTSSKYIAN